MKHSIKKLTLRAETIRSLDARNLISVAGARMNQTRSQCAGECPPNTGGGDTGGPTGGNICLATELTCYYC